MSSTAIEIESPASISSKLAGTQSKTELKSPASPLPEVLTFDAATVTADELVQALRVAGGVVVKNMLTLDEVKAIEKDVRPWLEKDKPWTSGLYISPN
jgi:hypothetical protein